MIKVGVLGSTGYAGAELTRLLAGHPEAELIFLDSRRNEGQPYSVMYPHLRGIVENRCISVDVEGEKPYGDADVVFCALPHGLSQTAVQKGLESGVKVIDLSADFRIADPKVYETWYKTPHIALDALSQAVYGLVEINREKIKGANVVANPGCYPTSILLATYPLLKAGLISSEGLIADSKSGVSGAGRNLSDGSLYGQSNESVKAYGIGTHRHTPEIEQLLSDAAGTPVLIQFTPHLIPMTRGILSTIYAQPKKGITEAEIAKAYAEAYQDAPFVRVLPSGEFPQTKAVAGSNFCDIGYKLDTRTNRIVLVSAIDNLIKGAAGQAVQNMNLMFGLKETVGISQMPLWP
ncbi:MAG: N-acetyl-gamma-glutamyl-phosphate reductase [Clostridiales bacterium]|jgi:N-acetyl-gamma-glutamyl-phosphate reductase|nr:N-acetyl-gamma-glutamyl-phosphate reductase [Clostridiales bacterium]